MRQLSSTLLVLKLEFGQILSADKTDSNTAEYSSELASIDILIPLGKLIFSFMLLKPTSYIRTQIRGLKF